MIAPEGLADVIRRAQAGDREAQERLLERLRPALQRFAERFGDSSMVEESVADLAQEAALRFWERFSQFQGAADDESTAAMLHNWLEQLVRRLAANRRDARHADKRRPPAPLLRLGSPQITSSHGTTAGIDPPGAGASPSGIAAGAERDGRIQAALQMLPDATDRQILDMCFVQGLSLRAVAEELHLSYDKVREHYHAGLRFLETELEGMV